MVDERCVQYSELHVGWNHSMCISVSLVSWSSELWFGAIMPANSLHLRACLMKDGRMSPLIKHLSEICRTLE